MGGRELIWGDWELIWRNGTHYRGVGSDLGEWKLIFRGSENSFVLTPVWTKKKKVRRFAREGGDKLN